MKFLKFLIVNLCLLVMISSSKLRTNTRGCEGAECDKVCELAKPKECLLVKAVFVKLGKIGEGKCKCGEIKFKTN